MWCSTTCPPVQFRHKVKYYLKEHDTIMQCTPSPIPLIQAAFDSITESDCKVLVSIVDMVSEVSVHVEYGAYMQV